MTTPSGGHGTRAEESARQAGTVVLLRDGEDGPECLMLHKTEGQTFGGLWVFPGGRVEPGDGVGLEGARRAAVREVDEETGVTVSADVLVPLSHWAPPPDAPKRFLTWFFVAPCPVGAVDVQVDGGEIGDHAWATPGETLAAHRRGEVKLLPPTWVTLRWLSGHHDTAAALRAAAAQPPADFATHIVDDHGTLVALWAPDAAYPADARAQPGPLDREGRRHRLYMSPSGWRYQTAFEV